MGAPGPPHVDAVGRQFLAQVSICQCSGPRTPPMELLLLPRLLVSLSLALAFLTSSGLVVPLLAPPPSSVLPASLPICSGFFFFDRAPPTLVAGEVPLFLLSLAPFPVTLAQPETSPFGLHHHSPKTR